MPFFFSPLENSLYSEWISHTEPEPRGVRAREEGTSHRHSGDLGWLLPGPLRLHLVLGLRPVPSGKDSASKEFVCSVVHRVVDGSFLTRLWARIDDSIGFSWGVGLVLLSAE